MNQLQLKVWTYLKSLPIDPLNGMVEIIYETDCPKLNIKPEKLVEILNQFEYIRLISTQSFIGEGYLIQLNY